jgi:hypothetical protein
MSNEAQPAIISVIALADHPVLSIRKNHTLYLVRNGDHNSSFHVVRWDRVQWICTCGRGRCGHKTAVNDLLVAESREARASSDDLAPHVQDGL